MAELKISWSHRNASFDPEMLREIPIKHKTGGKLKNAAGLLTHSAHIR